MSSSGQTVQVTVRLPKEIYERVTQAALIEQQQIEDLLRSLIVEGLEAHMPLRELWEHVSEDYRARLAREGKLRQASDDVLQELRDLREQIAGELYPR
jgi:siroheme synthase (precorrin-2 oxidase/ferrochelatase)